MSVWIRLIVLATAPLAVATVVAWACLGPAHVLSWSLGVLSLLALAVIVMSLSSERTS